MEETNKEIGVERDKDELTIRSFGKCMITEQWIDSDIKLREIMF